MFQKLLLLIFLWGFQHIATTQNLIPKYTYSKDISINYWVPDNVGNIYVYGNDILEKMSNGQLPSFSQSIKSVGEIEQILPINALKTLLFSETQQQLCFIDNTLSINGSCIDLEKFNIQNALLCATSSRPNLIYVYDQINSSLFLIDINSKSIVQTIPNLEGVIGIPLEISELLEHNNNLFIKTKDNHVYELDMFLNFKQELALLHKHLLFWKDYIVDFQNDEIILNHLLSDKIKTIPLEDISAEVLKINGDSFYFSTAKKIMVYELIPL